MTQSTQEYLSAYSTFNQKFSAMFDLVTGRRYADDEKIFYNYDKNTFFTPPF